MSETWRWARRERSPLPPGGLLARIRQYGIDLTAPGDTGGAP